MKAVSVHRMPLHSTAAQAGPSTCRCMDVHISHSNSMIAWPGMMEHAMICRSQLCYADQTQFSLLFCRVSKKGLNMHLWSPACESLLLGMLAWQDGPKLLQSARRMIHKQDRLVCSATVLPARPTDTWRPADLLLSTCTAQAPCPCRTVESDRARDLGPQPQSCQSPVDRKHRLMSLCKHPCAALHLPQSGPACSACRCSFC